MFKFAMPSCCKSSADGVERTKSISCGVFCVVWAVAGAVVIVGLVLKLVGVL
jgi:hypothetical protein